MKTLLTAILSIMLIAGYADAGDKTALKNEKDKVSYSIGTQIGNNFKNQSMDVDVDLLAKGIKDALSGGKLLMTEKEIKETITALQKDMMAKQAERMKVAAEKNRKEGEAFLSDNKKKEGVKTTPSGLQYKVIKDGNGPTPKMADTVAVNYRGTLINGTEFDSSYKREEPATFPVNSVIPGWTEAMQMMKVGSKWHLFVPANLAYGEQGAGPQIGPNSTLIFEVELTAINK
ncbi:MAG: FKBP-type peptidyl-prolyl cis-trans isomerase [Deltaproteobacteria bacterium]